jgi:hypothetical protein
MHFFMDFESWEKGGLCVRMGAPDTFSTNYMCDQHGNKSHSLAVTRSMLNAYTAVRREAASCALQAMDLLH